MVSRPSITPEALALAAVSLKHRAESGQGSPSAERLMARLEAMAVRELAAGGVRYAPPDRTSKAQIVVCEALDEAAAAGDPRVGATFRRAVIRHLSAHVQTNGTP